MKQCQLSGVDPMEHPEVRAILEELNSLPGSADDAEAKEMEEAAEFDQADLESGHIELEDAEIEWDGRREDGEKSH